ncbi:peroxiredoxin [Heterostelium album PN500]|uniref:thioredoxin-dependent peroxiredoxin n=1 Tax=Heterostelium pallidum (strain ATCC 26659 / Pp 5 / PN500) TaxID=670386 RepID=D3BEP4_HETP5|nr:peroxiredoxin [Heterostelium album PN500]EFA80375.1 peroxiredoxin [Heterostelium album PN500]|eukprot:XP_020432495.1 peroxiredoxin [Heterostelium album PN500]
MTGHCHKHEQIRIRKQAPKFQGQAVVNGEFKDISLDDYKGKYVYFFFYPLDFTFVCPTEIIAFSEAAEEFRKIGCEIIACSVDSVFSHLAWINTPRKEGGLGGIKFPILSDITHQVSKDYGVYIEEDGHTIRGSFIIGKDGLVKHIQLNDNPVGRNVEEALRLVKGYMYTDVHGEVCPANWNPDNSKTMIPDPKGSKAYFQSVNQ